MSRGNMKRTTIRGLRDERRRKENQRVTEKKEGGEKG